MIRVFLLAGQSNMRGAGITAEIAGRVTPPATVRLFDDGAWRDLLWQERFGPECGFALDIAAAFPDDQIVLCKVARGGANLYYDWNPDGVSKGPEDACRGPLYPLLTDAFTAVRREVDRPDTEMRVCGLLWMQGERDAVFEIMAAAYERNLAGFIAAVRRDTGTLDLPVILGEIAPRVYNLEKRCFKHAFREIVQGARQHVADADPRVDLVHTLDLPQRDNLHFDTAGQLELGRRLARAALELSS